MILDLNHRLTIAALLNYSIDDNGCWNYTGAINSTGYGIFTMYENKEQKTFSPHRASLAKKLNKAYEELNFACHTCDNKACINPDHLFEGSPKDNIMDASRKGRLRNQQYEDCPQGHPYNEENTRIEIKSEGKKQRHCRVCDREANHRRDEKARLAKLASKNV